jgi:hypothetical protein
MDPEDGTPEGIARHLPQEMTGDRIGDALREAEGEGYARELAGEWSLTEAGQTVRSAQDSWGASSSRCRPPGRRRPRRGHLAVLEAEDLDGCVPLGLGHSKAPPRPLVLLGG